MSCLLSVLEEGMCLFAVCTGRRNMSVCCLYWKKEYVFLLSVLEEGICLFAVLYWKKECICLLSVLEEGICLFAVCTGRRNMSAWCLYWKKECVHLLFVLENWKKECVCCLYWKEKCAHLLSALEKGMCPFTVCTSNQEGKVSITRTGMYLFTVYTRQGMCQFALESECVCLLPVLEKEFVCLLWKGNVSFAVHNGRHCTLQLLSEKGMWLFAVSTKEYMLSAVCGKEMWLPVERKCGCFCLLSVGKGNVSVCCVSECGCLLSVERKCCCFLSVEKNMWLFYNCGQGV